MVQETLSQYDINTPIVIRDGEVYRQVLRQSRTYISAAGFPIKGFFFLFLIIALLLFRWLVHSFRCLIAIRGVFVQRYHDAI